MGADLCEMELQRVIGTQTHIQPDLKKIWKWVALICQEQRIIAQGAHSQPNLFQVE